MSRSVTLLLVLVILTSSFTLSCKATLVEEASWTTLASMREARGGLGVAVVNGKIYALGGYSGSGPYLDTNEEFDPTTHTWTTKTPMPIGMAYFGVTVYQDKIYCISGESGATVVYDPATDTWDTKTSLPLPKPREGLKANTVGDKIYVVGGPVSTLNVYDIQSDTWTRKQSIPVAPRLDWGWSCASGVVDGKIHVIGVFSIESSHQTYSHQIYDPENDEWSFGEPCIDGYLWASAGVTSGVNSPVHLFVFGAADRWWPLGNVDFTAQYFDPEDVEWSSIDSSPTGRLNAGVAVLNDEVYVIGGFIPAFGGSWIASNKNEKYIPLLFGTIPQVSIVSPKNQTYSESDISLVFKVNEQTSWMGYSSDGQANVTITGNINLTNLSDGFHVLEVFARDILGDEGKSEVVFTVDTQPPVITVLSPQNRSYGDVEVLLSVSLDEEVSELKYSLNGFGNVTFSDDVVLLGLEIGEYNITVYATDLLGHSGASETIYFSIEPFPTTLVLASVIAIAVAGIGLVFYFKKRKGRDL